MERRKGICWQLFFTILKISAFTVGGGFVMVSLMRKKFVEELGWIDDQEMLDIAAISQSSPGAIIVNAAYLVGYRMAGVPGAICAVLGGVLPPVVVITAISFFYEAFRSNPLVSTALLGMRAGVAAVICEVVFSMGKATLLGKGALPILIFLAAFAANRFFKVSIVLIILTCGTVGAISGLVQTRKRGEVGK